MNTSCFEIGGQTVAPGESKNIYLDISETYTGDKISMPLRVIRSESEGPSVFVTAAIHGDEINGTGIIHDFLCSKQIRLKKGMLLLAPVINVFGFEAHERYLPDRRDLNRSFPGSPNGSLASRIANTLMTELVDKCDYGIDLHTAAFQRTNYPNVRADLSNSKVRRLAKAFGCVIVADGKGPVGSFRREATKRGCPTIILEAGEPWKVEPSVMQIGLKGIKNVLIELDMLDGQLQKPPYQAQIRKMIWVRAISGGILKFHVGPGDFVVQDQPIATNYSIFGLEQNILYSPASGIVLSTITMPGVKPGEPVCNIAVLSMRQLDIYRKKLSATNDPLYRQVRLDLATNLDVIRT